MSTHIGTNFNYRGKRFLDSRQGGTLSKSDLKNWDFEEIPVPSGFELCLNGHSWYYYNPDVTIEETGHWIPRLVDITGIDLEDEDKIDFSNRSFDANALSNIIVNIENKIGDIHNEGVDPGQGNILSDVEERLAILEGIHFPLEISNIKLHGENNNQTYEVGTLVHISPITYHLKRGGKNPVDISYELTEGIPETLSKPNESSHHGTWNHQLSAEYGGKTYTGIAKVTWSYKMYYGVVTTKPNNGNNISSSNFTDGGYTTSGKLSVKSFNCSGGKYPCILVPSVFVSANLDNYHPRIIVGGLDNSDLYIIRVNLILPNGTIFPYVAICLNTIQTGSNIQIELK
jgi:hypothetical protein